MLALLLAMGPEGRPRAAASGALHEAALARRAGKRRDNSWRQLSALNDATLRDIGMARPALGRYLVDPAPGKPAQNKPATAWRFGLPRPVGIGIGLRRPVGIGI